MNPAFSVVVFTVVAGAAQGLVVALALALLCGMALDAAFLGHGLLLAIVMLAVALGASFLHLGRPARAWRAVAMWRTSWLSREVIVLPAFGALVVCWWASIGAGAAPALSTVALPLLAIAASALLWWCTAMIYACLRFIEEWAQPLTLVNFALAGLASGTLLVTALATAAGERALATITGPASIILTVVAGVARFAAVRRNGRLRHRSTAQSATGIAAPRLAQQSMGMSAGSFNTREFFHGRSAATLAGVRAALFGLGYVGPAIAALLAIVMGHAAPGDATTGAASTALWWLAVSVQSLGLLADRWYFFAEAQHPQNLYYQTVS